MALTADYQPIAAYHAEFPAHRGDQLPVHGSRFDGTVVELSDLTVGGIRYPLRRRLVGQYFPFTKELIVNGFGSRFAGHGDSVGEAKDDFLLKVHRRFQELMYRRPFEFTNDDTQDWSLLCQMIDETAYRNATPIQMRQFGEVQYCQRSRPHAIRWDNGRQEEINPVLVRSPEYLTYQHGQPVEAVVERDRITNAIVAIPYITRSRNMRAISVNADDLNAKIGTSSDYPEAGWD